MRTVRLWEGSGTHPGSLNQLGRARPGFQLSGTRAVSPHQAWPQLLPSRQPPGDLVRAGTGLVWEGSQGSAPSNYRSEGQIGWTLPASRSTVSVSKFNITVRQRPAQCHVVHIPGNRVSSAIPGGQSGSDSTRWVRTSKPGLWGQGDSPPRVAKNSPSLLETL